MEPAGTIIREHQVQAGGTAYRIIIREEDLSRYYPKMVRYTMEIRVGEEILALARTNSHEYSPTMPFHARQVADDTVTRWEEQLNADPDTFLSFLPVNPAPVEHVPDGGVVVIQGSPRPGGNCAILASWAAEEARHEGVKTTVIYPHDMDINPCIGCYQCYNTGTCVFLDDMTALIDDVAKSRLVIICSPVYTNTVPAGLKALLDRFQALHGELTLGGHSYPRRGLLMAVAGRKGVQNFRCVSGVIRAFFSFLEITPLQPVLIDGMDEIRDVRTVPGIEEQVRSTVRGCLGSE